VTLLCARTTLAVTAFAVIDVNVRIITLPEIVDYSIDFKFSPEYR
jgi:hypothetical protein